MTAERSDMVVDLSIFCDEGNESEKERKKLNQEGMIMEYIQVTRENIEKEHICCAISNNKDVQVSSKKAWLTNRFDDGLVFLKSTERGKCFIEYIPAENAWNPIDADGYMYIRQ